MNLKYIFVFFISLFFTSMPATYTDDGIYQINELDYSYTSGYGMNQDVSYKIRCEYGIDVIENCQMSIKEYGKSEDEAYKISFSYKELDKIKNALNRYHILSWKGFSKSDKNVLDGDSFSFRLRYNDDEKLSASGYMMYPSKYKEFKEIFEKEVKRLSKEY